MIPHFTISKGYVPDTPLSADVFQSRIYYGETSSETPTDVQIDALNYILLTASTVSGTELTFNADNEYFVIAIPLSFGDIDHFLQDSELPDLYMPTDDRFATLNGLSSQYRIHISEFAQNGTGVVLTIP